MTGTENLAELQLGFPTIILDVGWVGVEGMEIKTKPSWVKLSRAAWAELGNTTNLCFDVGCITSGTLSQTC